MRRSSLDELLPEYDFAEVHSTRVEAAAAAAIAAAKAATPREMPLVRFLFALRGIPAREKDRALSEQMVELGFVPLVDLDDEVVIGFAGRPWKPRAGAIVRLSSAAAWSKFEEPGHVKAAMSFRADGGVLVTETRIRATDAASRRRFARYWRLIRPGSGLVRRSWLRASKRRAERR